MKPSKEFSIEPLLRADCELTQGSSASIPVVLMTRIRLARNLAGFSFPGRATAEHRNLVLQQCRGAVLKAEPMKGASAFEMDGLSELEKNILVERHLISRELAEGEEGSAVLINRDQSAAVMINEEDHLRIQAMAAGFNLSKVWKLIDQLDSDIERHLDFAFSSELGYLTACPTNVGTGLRASVMMHLPGLVITKNMDKVIRAVNQLGIVVRGLYGEGSDANGSVFQISNQQTLGESELIIIKRLENVLKTIIDHEEKARQRLLQQNPQQVFDQIGRAYGILRHCHLLNSSESMNLLSVMRLASDLGVFPETLRARVDRLFIEAQPGHIQYQADAVLDSEDRDRRRAEMLRQEFSRLRQPKFERVDGAEGNASQKDESS